MRTTLQQFYQDLRQPWQRALLLIALIPLFPEYISFPLVIAAFIFAMQDISQRGAALKVGTIGKLLLAYIGYMLITVIYSHDRVSTLLTVGMWLFLFVVYLIMNNLLIDQDRFEIIMLFITAVAGAVGLIACCQYRISFLVGGNIIRFWGWLDKIVYSFLHITTGTTGYVLRACSTFENPNILSEYLIMVAPFVAYFNFCERRKGLRNFCRICLFLTFGGIIFSFSRGGYIALLALALTLIILNIRHRFTTVTLYVFGTLLLLPDEVVERFLTVFPNISGSSALVEKVVTSATPSLTTTAEIINQSSADLAINDRWIIWVESLGEFLHSPVFGYGAGVQNAWNMLASHSIDAIHCHNIVLELLFEGGIIGLLLMMLVGLKTVKNGVELIRDGYGSSFWVGFAIVAFAACFLMVGMVDYPLLTPKLVCVFIMILGISERSVVLFSGHGIPVRQKLRRHLFSRRTKANNAP